jgi:hypothetical protein
VVERLAHMAKSSPICPEGAVVEIKGEDSRRERGQKREKVANRP